MGYRIGVDIGGTFTDAAVLNEASGEIKVAKRLSTPRFPVRSVLDAINETKVSPGDVTYIAHGTTVGTNAVIQRNGKDILLNHLQ